MAPLGFDLAETHIETVLFKRLNDVTGLIGRIEPVRGKGDDQEFGASFGKCLYGRSPAMESYEIVVIGGLCDVKKRVGVEALDEFAALISQITLHLEVGIEIE